MTEELDSNQGDLFPKLLQEETHRVERDVAAKKARDRLAFPARIDGYWHGFYQFKLAVYALDDESREQYGFDFRFCRDGELVLLFYYPTISEVELSEPEYVTFEKALVKLLDPQKAGENPDVDFTLFLRWTLDRYCQSDDFPESKLERIKVLLQEYGEINDAFDEVNILSTNRWVIDVDRSQSKPAVRLRARLNTISKVFVLDHFDCDAEEELFDLDDFKWWSRVDGEGVWGCYESLFGSKRPADQKSLWGRLRNWIGGALFFND